MAARAARAGADARRSRSTRCISARGGAARGRQPLPHLPRARPSSSSDYVADLGFTHIELLPVTEHPFDGSWGYQPIGLFAPTCRFGTPDDFAHLVDRCHQAGIGVILDWVPAHFPTDAHGLGHFDGTALYEHADPRQGLHRDWDTLIFNYGRHEVRELPARERALLARRVSTSTGCGSMPSPRCSTSTTAASRASGSPTSYGGRENLDAIAFLRRINERCSASTPAPPRSPRNRPPGRWCRARSTLGGLGFGFKWNMGWMHDTLRYMRHDPIHRKYHHNELTFGLIYAFTENFILPLSHDEVVHGKGSLIGKMPGDRWQKFANLRAYFGFMWTHPGQEAAVHGRRVRPGARVEPRREPRLAPARRPAARTGCSGSGRDLNRLYRGIPALHRARLRARGLRVDRRRRQRESVLVLSAQGPRRATAVARRLQLHARGARTTTGSACRCGGRWRELLNTDAGVYGGSDVGNGGRS